MTWIASATTDEDRVVAAEGGDETSCSSRTTRDAYDAYYNVIANPLLWFVQHSLWGLADAPVIDRATHAGVARRLRRSEPRVRGRGCRPTGQQPGRDRLLPRLPPLSRAATRARRASACAARAVRAHPVAGRLEHAAACAAASRSSTACSRTTSSASTPSGGRATSSRRAATSATTTVTHHRDLGRRRRSSTRCASSDAVLEQEARIDARPEKLIVRVDRTDPSKNIVRGFRAFELFLAEHPEWHGRVTMLALLDPSRQAVPEYAAYLGAIERGGQRGERALRPPTAGCRSTCRSPTTSRSPSPRTSSTTCCS